MPDRLERKLNVCIHVYVYDVPVLLTLLSREIRNNGIILRLQMESRHPGNQTRNGKTWKKHGIGIPLHSGFNVFPIRLEGAPWHLICSSIFFPESPCGPDPSLFLPFLVAAFFHLWFHFSSSGNLCFFQDGGPFGRRSNPTLTQWKRNGEKTNSECLSRWSFFEPVAPDALALAVFLCVFC